MSDQPEEHTSPDTIENDTPKEGGKSDLRTLLKDIGYIVTFYFIFTVFAWSAFHIPSGSMEPTLEVGDRIFVSKFAYGYSRYSVPFDPETLPEDHVLSSAPERGDVVVFTLPYLDDTDFIKRLIGLPGDTIQMTRGRLYINSVMIPRKFVRDVHYTSYLGTDIKAKEYIETLPGGVEHRIYERSDASTYDNTTKYVVPAGHYFMMGDNRDGSGDSRVKGYGAMGYIDHKYLVGRADVTTFSLYDCDQGKEITCPLGIPFGRFFNIVE